MGKKVTITIDIEQFMASLNNVYRLIHSGQRIPIMDMEGGTVGSAKLAEDGDAKLDSNEAAVEVDSVVFCNTCDAEITGDEIYNCAKCGCPLCSGCLSTHDMCADCQEEEDDNLDSHEDPDVEYEDSYEAGEGEEDE